MAALLRPESNPRRSASSDQVRPGQVWNRLEERQLLYAAEFELSSLLPANGGDGSKGFVTTGVVDRGRLGSPSQGYHPVGDVNQDGIDDFIADGCRLTLRVHAWSGRSVPDLRTAQWIPRGLRPTARWTGRPATASTGSRSATGPETFGGGVEDPQPRRRSGSWPLRRQHADPRLTAPTCRTELHIVYGGSRRLAAFGLADGASRTAGSRCRTRPGRTDSRSTRSASFDHAGMVECGG